MYPLTCLWSASDMCISLRTEGFAPLQFKMLFTTVSVTARAQVVFQPQTRTQCHSHVWRDMTAIFLTYSVPQLRRSDKIWAWFQCNCFGVRRRPHLCEENRRAVRVWLWECWFIIFLIFLSVYLFHVESYLNILCLLYGSYFCAWM